MKLAELVLFLTAFVVLVTRGERLLTHQRRVNLSIIGRKGPPTHQLSRRATDIQLPKRSNEEELWDNSICKGQGLLEAMKGSDADAGKTYKPQRETGQSPFNDIKRKKSSPQPFDEYCAKWFCR